MRQKERAGAVLCWGRWYLQKVSEPRVMVFVFKFVGQAFQCSPMNWRSMEERKPLLQSLAHHDLN